LGEREMNSVHVVGIELPFGAQRAVRRRVVGDWVTARFGPVGRLCPRCGSADHGRPRLADRHVSLAYADGLALVAVADLAVGVDLERDGPAPEGFSDRRAWTRYEALVKATGEGIRRDPAGIDRIDAQTAWLSLPAPYVGTVATLGRAPIRVTWEQIVGPV
jgi:4'-phosphopantetheinyl transferase